jgi:hypothetical protein
MYEILSGLTTIQLIDMLMSHNKLFVIAYCESADDVIAEYDLRKVILDILSARNEQEYYQRMAELGA